MNKTILLVLLFVQSFYSYSQADSLIIYNDESLYNWIDSEIQKGMQEYNIPAITFSLVQDSLVYSKGYGIERIDGIAKVSDSSSVFHIASISKTFVTTAIMQLVEKGKLNLDKNVNNYLRSFKIDYKGQPISINHLLHHTAGFDERNLYTTVLKKSNEISLENHLKKRMPPQIREVDQCFTYSNYGFALLGCIVESVSGLVFEQYVEQNILKPLEMNHSGFKMKEELNYVTSYLQDNEELIPYELDFPLAYPASSFTTTSKDMSNYLNMFLNEGMFKGEAILSKSSVRKIFKSEFKHFSEASKGYSLGFFTSDFNGFSRMGHTGVKQGFASDLVLIPNKKIGLFLCVNASKYPQSNTRKFMNKFIDNLLNKIISEEISDEIYQPKISNQKLDLKKYEGVYRFTRYAQSTLDKLGVLIGLAEEIEIIDEGNGLKILKSGIHLNHIKDDLFYSKEKNKYVAFGTNETGEITYFFSNGTSAYHKLKWFETIPFQVKWIASVLVTMIVSLCMAFFRLLLIKNRVKNSIRFVNFIIALSILLGFVFLGYSLVSTDPQQFVYGVPLLLKVSLFLPFVTILFQLLGIRIVINNWRNKIMKKYALVYHTMLLLVSIAVIPWWLYWNIIGFNY